MAKFHPDLSTLISSTLVGGSAVDFPRGLVLDDHGNVVVTGNTTSQDFPVTDSSRSAGYSGGNSRGDVFVLSLDGDLGTINSSALFGGEGEDTGFAIAIDAEGGILITGSTNSADFPTTPTSYDGSYNGGSNDSFLLRLVRTRFP